MIITELSQSALQNLQ